jgi:hypothetical protein
LVELQQSGRWSRYYDEAKFLAEMGAAVRTAEEWVRIAPDMSQPVATENPGGPRRRGDALIWRKAGVRVPG